MACASVNNVDTFRHLLWGYNILIKFSSFFFVAAPNMSKVTNTTTGHVCSNNMNNLKIWHKRQFIADVEKKIKIKSSQAFKESDVFAYLHLDWLMYVPFLMITWNDMKIAIINHTHNGNEYCFGILCFWLVLSFLVEYAFCHFLDAFAEFFWCLMVRWGCGDVTLRISNC